MYVTGNITNYEKRIHQFCVDSGDLITFITERSIYSPSDPLLNTWEREENKKISLLNNPRGVLEEAPNFLIYFGDRPMYYSNFPVVFTPS